MKKLLTAAFMALMLSGCAAQTVATRVPFTPVPNDCQITKTTEFLHTTVIVQCWDQSVKLVHANSFQGTSHAQVTMSAVNTVGQLAVAGTTVYGAKTLYDAATKAASTIDGATINTNTTGTVTTTGNVTTSGTVNAVGTVGITSIPPVTVNPVPVSGNINLILGP